MLTYLLIDDEPLIRKGTIKKIERESLPVTCIFEANNGKEALDFLQGHPVDFIITDMDMPEVNGVELLQILDETYQQQIPIIVISGYENFSYIQQAMKSQAVNYILKPFNRKEINEAVTKVMTIYEEREKQLQHRNELLFGELVGNSSKSGKEMLDSYLKKETPYFFVLFYQPEDIDKESDLIHEQADLFIQHPFVSTLFFAIYTQKNLTKLKSCSFNNLYFCIEEFKSGHSDLNKVYSKLIQKMNLLKKTSTPGELFMQADSLTLPAIDLPSLKNFVFLLESGSVEQLENNLNELFDELIKDDRPIGVVKNTGLSIIHEAKK